MHLFKLKKYYFIDQFNKNKISHLDPKIIFIWRGKYDQKSIINIQNLAEYLKKKNRKFFISNNVKLALKLKLNGVYISAYNKDLKHNNYALTKNFEIIGSAHDLRELQIKKIQNTKEIFLAPIFKIKKKAAIGIHKAKYLFYLFKGPKIALGGINEKNIKLLTLSKFSGFAAINYFK